jgi:hypothetical protein
MSKKTREQNSQAWAGGGGVSQCQSPCVECRRPWVPSPAMKKKKSQMNNAKRRESWEFLILTPQDAVKEEHHKVRKSKKKKSSKGEGKKCNRKQGRR